MIPAIVLAAIQQRLRSPVRMVLTAMAFVFPLLGAWFAPALGLQGLSNGFFFGAVLAAGLIGQDVSAGVLQLLFARPVRRWEYVLSRWFAYAMAAAVLVAVQVAIGGTFLALRGFPIEASGAIEHAASQMLAAIGSVAVFTLLSSLIGGLGDLALWAMAWFMGLVFQIWGSVAAKPSLLRVSQEINGFIWPELDITRLMGAADLSWFTIVSYVSTVTVCLAVAVVMVNRKELSYASG